MHHQSLEVAIQIEKKDPHHKSTFPTLWEKYPKIEGSERGGEENSPCIDSYVQLDRIRKENINTI